MENPQGTFIVLEGSDGSGKATQLELLQKRLIADGYEVETFAFPRYDQPSSHFVRQYLKGAYGRASSVNPYTASLFYALDRYEAAPLIRNALSEGKIVLADRYAGSNMAHQGSKFVNAAERRGFFVWAESIEFQLLGIPRPNLNVFLRVPAEVSFKLIHDRPPKDTSVSATDQHEGNLEHLKASVETYDMLCQLFAVDFKSVDCVKNGVLLPRQAIHEFVWQAVKPILSPPAIRKPKSTTGPSVPTRPQPNKNMEVQRPSSTETEGVLEWRIKGLSLIAVSGLQQAGLDIKVDYDDHWHGPGTSYRYITPEGLSGQGLASYDEAYRQAAELHKKLFEKLTPDKSGQNKGEDLGRAVVPMGAIFSASVRIDRSKASLTLEKLRTHPNREIAALQSSLSFLLNDRGQVKPGANKHSQITLPESINDILGKISANKLTYGADLENIQITEFSPRNEFELIADGIYPRSSLTRDEILAALDKLNYDQKAAELKKALSSEAIMDLPFYRFDALTDWLSLSALMEVGLAEIIHVQQITPRYGYDMPAGIEEINGEDLYMEIFDSFLGLYSELQKEHDDSIIEYATLAGNKVRWQGRLTAGELKSLKTKKFPELATLINHITDKVREIHPLLAEELSEQPLRNVRPRKTKGRSRKK